MPTLLLQHLRADTRKEDGIQIDINQVVEVGQVGRSYWVGRLVRIGHGVEKGLHRTLQQFEEGLLYRIFARTAEHGMLKNMRDPRVIIWWGAKGDPEALILIIALDREQFGTAALVPVEAGTGVDLRHLLVTQQGKSVVLVHDVSPRHAE